MLFRETKFFCDVIDNCIEEDFLQKVCEKYHYQPEDREGMKQTALAMQDSIREQALWRHSYSPEKGNRLDGVVMTLGEGIDRLQEGCAAAGEFWTEYLIEILSGELLLLFYEAYNRFMEETTPYHVARYHFPGSEKEYPLAMVPELLKELSAPIACNESYCMIPGKSVAFFALLTKDKRVRCAGICGNCGRKDCLGKAAVDTENGGGCQSPAGSGQAGFPGLRAAGIKKEGPLPYGYARILGKEFI